jgi:hypothetical protein
MSKFALGRHAIGMCDRCGQQYKLHELRSEVINLEVTSFLVCPECWDPDNPQTQLGRYFFDDPQAVRDPRPPQSLNASRYSGAVRYDFTDSAEDFTLTTTVDASETVYGAVSYNASSGTITSTPSEIGIGLTLNGLVSPTVSFDSSTYDYVRVRVKLDAMPEPNPNESYDGTMFWRTDSGAYSKSAKSITNPDWFQMGEPYQLLTWDMRGNADWSGTITGLVWRFFYPLTKSGVYEIDYVRFEKSASQTP